MDFMFNIFPIIFLIMFGLVAFTIVSNLIHGAKINAKNNSSPILDVDAEVVVKRDEIRRRATGTDNMGGYINTNYYATFQFESGDRMEFQINGTDYGMLREGDKGNLRFQGSRFISFARF